MENTYLGLGLILIFIAGCGILHLVLKPVVKRLRKFHDEMLMDTQEREFNSRLEIASKSGEKLRELQATKMDGLLSFEDPTIKDGNLSLKKKK